MAGYRTRVERDLDRWIATGLVPAGSREPILAGLEPPRRLEAGAALAVVGVLLAGAAAIAFVAANWDGLPRIIRFALVLAGFLVAAGAAAWASRTGRPLLTNSLLTLAALIYAAAIGLTGQIFDIAGDPQVALRSAGLAAAVLALAGRSSGAAAAALALIGMGDMAGGYPVDPWRWSAFAAPLGVALAWLWRSRPLAHAAGLALLLAWMDYSGDTQLGRLLAAAAFAALAAATSWRRAQVPAADLLGWFVAGALIAFGLTQDLAGGEFILLHRAALLLLAAGVTAWGRHERHDLLTALGVLGVIAAVSLTLFDLGFGLLAAAGVFAACAVAALAGGWLLRRRAAA
jgi:uncharacterized membrane protein